jgi:hypothetical protein
MESEGEFDSNPEAVARPAFLIYHTLVLHGVRVNEIIALEL